MPPKASGSKLGVGQKLSSGKGAYQPSTGERVRHRTFGEGLVIKTTPMGNDLLVEVAFDTAGVKKMMANFARLEPIDA